MCFVIWVNQERFDREGERVDGKYRRRFPRFVTWLLGPQAPPPQYNEAISPQHSQIKPVTQRPDSITLPKYVGLRKHPDAQMLKMDGSKEIGNLQEEMRQD